MSKKKGLKIALGAIGAGAAAAGIVVARKKSVDPTFTAKNSVRKAVDSARYTLGEGPAYDNGTSLTPPMGWSSWNAFREKISEELMLEIGEAMRDAGLLDAGYEYLNLDDCWHSSSRDDNGKLQGDLSNFPNGIPALVKKVNDMGFKLGVYSSNGTMTCEDLPASLNKEILDAQTFAEWGVEYFKYDFCYNIPVPTTAPRIEKLIIGGGGLMDEMVFPAKDALLSGSAKAYKDDKLGLGAFVAGLDANGGAITFESIEMPSDGEYVLTLGLRKQGDYTKFLIATVNGADQYEINLPPTKSWSVTSRTQIRVNLRKGLNSVRLHNPICSKTDSTAYQYRKMGTALKNATKEYALKNNVEEKKIVYSICEWGLNRPWKWGKSAGNLWRTTPDIFPKWISILGIYEANVLLHKSSTKGGWNDPDMLQVGNGKLTYDENVSHFSVWCMMAAPLMLGNDLREWRKDDGKIDKDNDIFKILTNKDMIAIDQDPLGVQCIRFRMRPQGMDILVKPLVNNEVAVCFFNKGLTASNASVQMDELKKLGYLGTQDASTFEAFDVWSKETTEVQGELRVDNVPSHGVRVLRVKVK